MKKIIYVNFSSIESSGITNKLENQAKSLKSNSKYVEVICFIPYHDKIANSENVTYVNFPKFIPKLSLLQKPKFVSAYLKNYDTDIVILRFMHCTPFFWYFFRNKQYKLIVEYHALIIPELMSSNRYIIASINFFSKKLCDSVIDAKVCVTQEILEAEKFTNPMKMISNGTEVVNFKEDIFKPYDQKNLSIIFIASLNQPWQGLNRILHSLREWIELSDINITIHIVGNINSSEVDISGIEDNIIFHGYLAGKRLDNIFKEANVAFSTLALYTKKMQDACSLKSREYLSRGIPFIYAYIDPDISEDFGYALKVPNNDTIVDFSQVEQFLLSLNHLYNQGDNISSSIRKYAEEHIGYNIKAKEYIEFCQTLNNDLF